MLGFVKAFTTILGLIMVILNIFFFIRFRSRHWIYLVIFKMLDNSLAFYFVFAEAVIVILGILSGALLAIIAGIVSLVISTQYVFRVTKSHSGFETAFGLDWLEKLPPALKGRMLPHRRMWLRPRSSESEFTQDIPFWKISDKDQNLLCDIWQPAPGNPRSGVGLIYLHGSAWHYSDKDYGTRPFFSHLTTQGHVVMDVAYRLCPQVDLWEMLGDVKRAILWMKSNAYQYGIDPSKIVLAGASAGAHLALLAAYTSKDPHYTSKDIQGQDVTVNGVVSYYGPTDLSAFFINGFGCVNPRSEVEKIQRNLLGGLLEDIPEVYKQASPISHISPDCPATLIFQGSHDMGVPVENTRIFYRRLSESGIPVVYVEFPQTDHGFDIQMKILKLGDGSQYSPANLAAWYDLDRFLAFIEASGNPEPVNKIRV
jgi:acetyl esterase/lipase